MAVATAKQVPRPLTNQQELYLRAHKLELLNLTWKNYTSYFLMVAALGILAFASLRIPETWPYLPIALFAAFWLQTGYLGHDCGHNAVFQNTKYNLYLGRALFSFLLGMAFDPWRIRHNLHHALPNVDDEPGKGDPDRFNKIICYTEKEARKKRGLARWIVRYQAWLWFPLTLFATVGFRIDAWKYATGHGQMPYNDSKPGHSKYIKNRRIELALISANAVFWLLAVPFIVDITFWEWYSVLIPGQMLFGLLMANAFAPNHKGQDAHDATNPDTVIPEFVKLQVETACDVTPGLFNDWIYGGLNHQSAHHAFPRMARCFQWQATLLLRQFCDERGIRYTVRSILRSIWEILKELDRVGRFATA